MIDTLTISKELEEAGLTRSQANAVAHQMRTLTENSLASKENLKTTELSLQKEIEEVRLSLTKEIEEVRLSLTKEINEVKLSLTKEISSVKVEVKTIEANLQKELRQTSNVTIKWVAAMLIGQTALITTLIKIFS
ncbi:MAG: hypothetical protein GDA42_09965 [Ekhidna sp.]|nr:hypothetical protein [Ekhidna sp.]